MSPQASDGPEVWWVEVEERLIGSFATARSSHGREMRDRHGLWRLTERGAARAMARRVRRYLRIEARAQERESNASVYPVD